MSIYLIVFAAQAAKVGNCSCTLNWRTHLVRVEARPSTAPGLGLPGILHTCG